jgi:hypothetical protein
MRDKLNVLIQEVNKLSTTNDIHEKLNTVISIAKDMRSRILRYERIMNNRYSDYHGL